MPAKDMLQFGVKTTGTTAAQTQLKGVAASFVALQAAVQIAQKALQTLQQWVGESIKSYRSFEKKIREVSTILSGEATQAVNGLQAGIENLSKSYGKSADDLAEGTYQILSAAFDASEAMNLLTTATKASIAGLTDVATSVDVFTSILNSYGMTVYQADEISDQLFQTVVRGKLRFEDLANAMGYVTPIAANVGVEFNEIAAALSTVTRMGLHVDMATRGLALALQNIANPTAQAGDAARKYEVDMSNLALQINGLEGFIKDLNEAMDDYGAAILPEMIRNMRSLRVVMALAGDEGIAGFTEDLDLLEKSSGRTEEALTKMMSSAQMEADIVAQSFEYLNRRIGEAWQDIDIWWKRTQVFWGTFFGSWGDAGKAGDAVREIDDRIKSIKENYVNLMYETAKYTGKKSLFNILAGGFNFNNIVASVGFRLPSALNFNAQKTIEKQVDFKSITRYFDILETLEKKGGKASKYSMAETALETVGFYKDWGILEKTTKNFKLLTDTLEDFDITLDSLGDTDPFIDLYDSAITVDKVFDRLSEGYDDLQYDMEELQSELETVQPAMNYYVSLFDTASQSINTHKTNLLSLSHAIKDLKHNVEDTYTSFGGHTFTGKLGYEIGVAEKETELSRSQQYTNMALKYGTDYINSYNDELADSIMIVQQYTDNQNELTKILQEQNDIIKRNNMAILELQLKGMIRRRGNTRSEELKIKKLQISNAEARLENMKTEYESEQEITNTAYEDAQAAIQEHYDILEHELFEFKDVRDDEIQDLKDEYEYQKYLLENYEKDYTSEMLKLENANKILLAAVQSIRPEFEDEFEAMFGINKQKMITDLNTDLDDFIERLKTVQDIDYPDTNGGGSGGSGTTQPSPPEEPKSYKVSGFATSVDRAAKIVYGYIMSTSGNKKSGARLRYTSDRDIDKLKSDAISVMKHTYSVGQTIGWQRGTQYVPRNGLYMLHGGEKITPRSTQTDINGININIVNNNTINNDYDANKIAMLQGEAVSKAISDARTGKSKYRLR